MKRAFDICLALMGLPFAVPVLLICMLAIRLNSPGPAIFIQRRVGRDEKPFNFYKLRTMHRNTAESPSHHTPASSVTSVGKWLRATKLDELPQLFNILKGDMSFVGPRPCLQSQTELIEYRRQRGVYALMPGITGVAQVRGIHMSEPERLAEVDATYLRPWSLTADLRLIIMTVFGAGRGDRVQGV